jgi:pSer/pThr/pTyr-binding forkhead associated (FHA) protein
MPETLMQPAKLLVKLHGKGSRQIDLTPEIFTIGRKTDNTLSIEDPAVSGHHAQIVKVQSVFFLEDLKSTNGTAVNGQPITRHQLRDADVITIGQHRLVFQENMTTSTTTPASSVDLDRTMVLRRSSTGEAGARRQGSGCCRENRSVGISTHQTGECHRITERSSHSVNRLVRPQIRRNDRPTRP